MKSPSNISHPLKNETGTSQRTRVIEALSPDAAPIDGKTLADRLHLIGQYARHINFYEVIKDPIMGEYQQLDNWSVFFKNSLPFQLANLGKTDLDDLDDRFLVLNGELRATPSKQALESVLSFILHKLILPTGELYTAVELNKNSFTMPLLGFVNSSFLAPLRNYIALYNASVTYLCVGKKSFSDYREIPWQLGVSEIYALDSDIKNVTKGKKEAYLNAAPKLEVIFRQMSSGMQDIVAAAPDYISESLVPLEASLQKKHRPHLGLLFTFLELFKQVQGNINELGKKHLDFFYEKVLKLMPKDAVADRAHIVFEVAKHLKEYPLPKDLLLKDGKDVKQQEIRFGLDHEIILDKAQVKEVRTLSLYPVETGGEPYIEGAYIAPMANTQDGVGKAFEKDLPVNWPTLGSKYSKNVLEGKSSAEEHPRARLGFVLASPVLLLQEGKRTVNFTLSCDWRIDDPAPDPCKPAITERDEERKIRLEKEKSERTNEKNSHLDAIANGINGITSREIRTLNDQVIKACSEQLSLLAKDYLSSLIVQENPYEINEKEWENLSVLRHPVSCEPIFMDDEIDLLARCMEKLELISTVDVPLFKIGFSGEKEWLEPELDPEKPDNFSITATKSGGLLVFNIKVVLEPDFPSVVFYDGEALKEKIDVKDIFPMAKITLNNAMDITVDRASARDLCCLKKQETESGPITVSAYHFLQKLILVDAKIEVTVCGVKNLIVQNDENLQDVNKPISPFGPRPKVGDNWFIDGGANFYIGSKEIFCKNWQKFWINTTWKDKPSDLENHYKFYTDPPEDGSTKITNGSFRFATSILEEGKWKRDETIKLPNSETHRELLKLFENYDQASNDCGKIINEATFCHGIERNFTPQSIYFPKSMPLEPLQPLTVNTRKGFARLTLAGASFQHDRYTYVLARQMMALANLLDPESIEMVKNDLELLKILATRSRSLVNSILTEINFVVNHVDRVKNILAPNILALAQSVEAHLNFIGTNYDSDPAASKARVNLALTDINSIIDEIGTAADGTSVLGELTHASGDLIQIKDFILDNPGGSADGISDDNVNNDVNSYGLQIILIDMDRRINRVADTLDVGNIGGIPNEPYTPLIKSLSIDYEAMADKADLEIVHLHAFENTSKHAEIDQDPTLFPYYDDEGTLFIGLEELTPGGNLSLLFQLAEATADSESDRAKNEWHYLSNNSWMLLRPEFEVLSDETDGLTVSGIVTLAIPDTITRLGNTIMPDDLFWIKVSVPENAKAVAETLGIHTQAARASARFGELSDRNRLETGLPPGSIAKLVNGDFAVKKVQQPYDSYDGRKPEAEGHFYTRVSEHLKHKGRSIMGNDYEKIVLEGFPKIYKVKCIGHTMGLSANSYRRDLEVAPGYAVVTVIPDLTQLKSGNMLQPKVPVSLLEKIGVHIRKKTSPFARIKVMNPRYEAVNVHITVRLYRGKSVNFYSKKLKEDITGFLAPWFLGDSEKLAFGQVVLFSDVVGFTEQLDYVDFIVDLALHGECEQTGDLIKPLTARSILVGGEICVRIDGEECIKEQKCRPQRLQDPIPETEPEPIPDGPF